MKKLAYLINFVAGMLLLFGTIPAISQTGGFANVSQPSSSVTVSTGSALISAIQQGNQTVYVSGSISISNMNDVASNTAIIGLGTNARITGGGLDIDGVTNVIVKNITFEGADDDAINIQEGSTHVWIDHCSFGPCADGQVDIKRESNYITVSWNHSYGGHDHCFLLGHSDSYTEDKGLLKVTYHHNFFEGEGRNPRVRFSGLTHVYNNYYNGCDYGVASTMDANCLVEGNYFNNVDDPCLVGYASSGDGNLVERNNIFNNSGSPETKGSVPSPPYGYSLQSASDARSAVINGAGVDGSSGTNPDTPVTGVSVSPTSATIGVGQTKQLSAYVSPSNASNTSVSWSSSNSGVASVNSSGLVTGVSTGNATITVKTSDGGYTATCNVTVTGSSTGDPCDNPTSISLNFSYDGAGEFCWFTKDAISHVNSWSLNSLTINGVDYTNTWSNSMPGRIDDGYYISYSGSYGWSHFDATALKSAESYAKGTENKISVYPNPVADILTIATEKATEQIVTVTIYNSVGLVVKKAELTGKTLNIDMSELPNGTYLVNSKNSDFNTTTIIVK